MPNRKFGVCLDRLPKNRRTQYNSPQEGESRPNDDDRYKQY